MIFSKEVKKIVANSTAFYDIGNILEFDALYNIVYGKRSNGKTYGCLEHGLKQFLLGKGQMAIIRRWDDDFSKKNCDSMFESLVQNGLIEKYTNGEWQDVYYKSKRWYFSKLDKETNKVITSDVPFCFAFALTTWQHDKSTSYPNVNTIIFDEFITKGSYLPDEFSIFCNVLSTIIRQRDGVKIFMLGNTVSKYCPYFEEMGLKHIKNQEKGTIDLYEFGDSGLTVAVEYTTENAEGHKSDKYFAFDNPKLKMITSGEWELDVYPHKPEEFKREQIMFTYYIKFDEQLLQCEIVKGKHDVFTYIHERKGFLDIDKDDVLIYKLDYTSRPNHRRKLNFPIDKLDKKLYSFFQKDNVYYQNNNVGDIVRNYFIWANQE